MGQAIPYYVSDCVKLSFAITRLQSIQFTISRYQFKECEYRTAEVLMRLHASQCSALQRSNPQTRPRCIKQRPVTRVARDFPEICSSQSGLSSELSFEGDGIGVVISDDLTGFGRLQPRLSEQNASDSEQRYKEDT